MPSLLFMACIDNIVTLGICPDEEASTSGFTLLSAPGMSPKIFANIANENYSSGLNLAMEKKALAINQVRNDFIGALQGNNVITMMAEPVYDSSRFNTGVNVGTHNGDRGIVLTKTKRFGGLRKTRIKNISLYPLASGDAIIKIIDGNTETQYAVTLVGNRINTFEADYTLVNYQVKIVIDQSSIAFASAPLICHKGCNNQTPNNCAFVEGWNGISKERSEGYGVNVQFYCHCDYDQIMCDVKYFGEIIWLKWRMCILEEQKYTNRFSNWVIYKADQIDEAIQDVSSQYVAKWNEMMNGIYGILRQYKDECLDCRGVRIYANI